MSESKVDSQLKELTPYHSFRLIASHAVQNMSFQGSQRLNLLRPTRLPASSRRYTRGDPVHLIDWRAFARTEQLIIRENYDEARRNIQVIVDNHPALKWPDQKTKVRIGSDVCSKLEIAWRLALHLTYQFKKSGDKADIYSFEEDKFFRTQCRNSADVAILFEGLKSDAWQVQNVLIPYLEIFRTVGSRSDLIIWISDGLQGIPDWLLSGKNSMRVWIQVLSSLETDLSWLSGNDTYFDEGIQAQEYLGDALLRNDELATKIRNWQENLKRSWIDLGGQYLQVTERSRISPYLDEIESMCRKQNIS